MSQNVMTRPLFGVYTLSSREIVPQPATAKEPERVHLAVPHFRQQLSLSCEMASLRMAAHYLKVVHSEAELVQILPRDNIQPRFEDGKLVWADANHTFPGNIRGWQLYHGGMSQKPGRARRNGWGYGVYGPGIAEVATRIGLQAEVFNQVDHVYTTLDRGQVPIVIVPCSGRSTTRKWHWYSPQGHIVPAINAQHAIVVVGYNDQQVWVNDPLGKVSSYKRIIFERAFAFLTSGVAMSTPITVVPAPSKQKVSGPKSQGCAFWRSVGSARSTLSDS